MKIIQRTSIKNKLLVAGMLTTCLVLFIASAVFLTTDLISSKRVLIDDLTGYAKTISANCSAALVFQDNASANETLRALKSVPSIMSAIIYDKTGKIFAAYYRDNQAAPGEEVSIPAHDNHLIDNHIDVVDTVLLDNENIGAIHIRSDLTRFYSRAIRYGIVLFVVMALAFTLSLLLFSRLHGVITAPIIALTDLMRTVSEKQDYSVRTGDYRDDELGFLARGFNTMLEKIQERDVEISLYHTHLEDLIEKRTIELKTTNKELGKELAERIRVEEALTESERRYRTIFETTGNPSLIIGADTTIHMINSAFERMLGYNRKEVEGKMSWTSFVAADDLERLKGYHYARRIDPRSAPTEYECHVIDRAGNVLNVVLTAASIPGTDQSVTSLLDMTERKRLEEQLIQSQKMEAIGQLAGGVAHDFNNILTAIIGYGSLIQMNIQDNKKLMEYMEPLLISADKAKHLTQALLAFSRKQIIAPKPVDLNEVIKNVRQFIIRLIGEDIEMTTHFAEENLVVFADAGQLDQVLMNFATNARDAMPDGGTFSIETDIVTLGEIFFRKHHYGKPGKYALICVSDTGVGISKKTMEHIFEPFFTTKEVGKGTGLGLSIVYGIVKQNNGYINVYSEPDNGTVFKIYLPLIQSQIEEEKALVMEKPHGGNEVILLAEDDNETRGLIKEVLKGHGYTIIEAVDGEDALIRYNLFHEKIALVIVDVIMPKKNGKAVYEEIKKTYPDAQALFISGYTAEIIHKKGIVEENINFLEKPIIANILLTKVRDILDNGRQ